jgi:hypothetical protein
MPRPTAGMISLARGKWSYYNCPTFGGQDDIYPTAAQVIHIEFGLLGVHGDKHLWLNFTGNSQQVGTTGVPRGMQPLLFLRDFPLAVPFYGEPECAGSPSPVPRCEVHWS